jgi:Cytochrome c oxidase subunit VIa
VAIATSFVLQPVSLFFCCVVLSNAAVLVAVCVAWVYNAEVEHKAHLDHIKAENGGVLPELPGYDYLNKRAKPFPWGMNSLFFNPHVVIEHFHIF